MREKKTNSYIERVTENNKTCFFGYYNISPESEDGNKIIYNEALFDDHMPEIDDKLSIMLYDIINDKRTCIGTTYAWNFQEGCRAQWISKNSIIFNDRASSIDTDSYCGYVSRVYDCEKQRITRTYGFPVYHVGYNKRIAITYNLNRSRYSYAHIKEDEETDYNIDGVFLCDLDKGTKSLIISLDELSCTSNTKEFNNWVEHCDFNRSCDRFSFFHRWIDDNGQMNTRLCVSDIEGNYKVLLDNGFCSHTGWKNRVILTAWGRLPGGINRLQRDSIIKRIGLYKALVFIYHKVIKSESLRQMITNDSYIFFNTDTCENKKIDNESFKTDGHCTWSKNGKWMITDTYPDNENYRHLFLYSRTDNSVFEIGKFFSYPDIRDIDKYSVAGIRCDLHPKWSISNKYVYFDSTHEGYRGLYRFNIERMIEDRIR